MSYCTRVNPREISVVSISGALHIFMQFAVLMDRISCQYKIIEQYNIQIRLNKLKLKIMTVMKVAGLYH